MFSGIVKALGTIVEIERQAELSRVTIDSPLFRSGERVFGVGDSIAVSGVCLTVVTLDGRAPTAPFLFDVGSETLRKTTLSGAKPGQLVNLEPSLRMGDSLDGHLVQGHVDCVATVRSVVQEGNTFRVEIGLPAPLRPLVAPKGAITVDGVSLTVGEVGAESFSVYVVPHTWQVTTMQGYEAGTAVNLEGDMIARYLQRLLEMREVAR